MDFPTQFSLVDTEAVDKSSIYLFLEIELELEEPPYTNVDKAEEIKLSVYDCLKGAVSPDLECSYFSLDSRCETDFPWSFHVDPLKAYFILNLFVQTCQ